MDELKEGFVITRKKRIDGEIKSGHYETLTREEFINMYKIIAGVAEFEYKGPISRFKIEQIRAKLIRLID